MVKYFFSSYRYFINKFEYVSSKYNVSWSWSCWLDYCRFYFCGRKPEGEFPYCKLHVLYAFQPKNQKEDDLGDEIPEFIEKKVKASSG